MHALGKRAALSRASDESRGSGDDSPLENAFAKPEALAGAELGAERHVLRCQVSTPVATK